VREDFPIVREDFPITREDFPIAREDFPTARENFPTARENFPIIGGRPRESKRGRARALHRGLSRRAWPPPRGSPIRRGRGW